MKVGKLANAAYMHRPKGNGNLKQQLVLIQDGNTRSNDKRKLFIF